MNYSLSDRWSLTQLHFTSRSGDDQVKQLKDCYDQLREVFPGSAFSKIHVLKQSIFISSRDKAEYLRNKSKLIEFSKTVFNFNIPTSVISQRPAGDGTAVELVLIGPESDIQASYFETDNTVWCRCQNGNIRLVTGCAAGDSTASDDILEQCNRSFEGVQAALNQEGMNFGDIFRQWNYIEQITGEREENGEKSQRYQIFNDVRSAFYQTSSFPSGYPSATGIGMDLGGIVIEFMALQGPDNLLIPVKSPVQKDAYQYTTEVLAENHRLAMQTRTSPKFERAKVLTFKNHGGIFISGTAAIKGQTSNMNLSAADHTEMTIQNILQLISPENLAHHGIPENSPARVRELRVYVKNTKDVPEVKTVCNRFFPGINILYVISDICRPELLVEIEGLAEY